MTLKHYVRFSAFAALLTLTANCRATPINPLNDQFGLKVDGTELNQQNTTFDALTGTLTFTDLNQTYTFVEADASPLVDALLVSRTCITLNVGGCSTSTVAVSNASALGGALQASALVGVTLQATANVGVSNLLFAHLALNAGAETALVGYPDGSPSPTPEPNSLLLLSTGLLGAAGAVRYRKRRTLA